MDNTEDIAKHQKVIHYKVNSESQETDQAELTPKQIMERAKPSPIDSNQNYLVRIHGNDQTSYKDDPDTPIKMHDGMHFISVFTGPVPVSFDPNQGPNEFVKQLGELGYAPECEDNKVSFEYTPSGGRFKGRALKLGFVVSGDFPRTPPGGPHFSPPLLPVDPNAAAHPARTHESPPAAFGDGWQYWSRPFPNWTPGIGVAGYMAYIDYLFDIS